MNWIVITIGTALVLALFAALVGPLFVDWTAYRSTIEQNAEAFLGTRVRIDGEAELRLLPSPRIRLTDVRLGAEERPLLTAASVELDVDLTPLLRGEFHVLDLRLDQPLATMTIQPDGKVAVPDITIDRRFAALFRVENVTVENISVSNGELRILDRRTGSEGIVTDISMTGDARTLRGPFTATGSARIAGVEQRIQLAGGKLEAGTMPLSAKLLPAGTDIALGFEGAIVPRPDALAVRGNVDIAAGGRNAWSVKGELRASPAAVTLSGGTVRYGLGDAAMEFAVDGRYTVAQDEPLSLSLAARQLDLDRLVRALKADTAPADAPAARPPGEWAGAVAAHFAPVLAALDAHAGLDIPIAATLDIGNIVAGGSLVRDVSAAIDTAGVGLTIERAEALLPGDTTVEVDGALGESFSGNVSVSASQPAVLARWWTGRPFTRGTMDPVFVEADLDAGADGLDAQRLTVRIGQSTASGRTRYSRRGGEPPLLDVSLAAPRLDVSDIADAWAVLAAAGLGPAATPDILIDLSADEILVGDTEGASFNLDASYREGMLTIDALGAEDIAGAQIFASGGIGDLLGTPVGAIEGTVLINDGDRLQSALSSLGRDNALVARLAEALPALAPADLRVSVSGGSGAGSAQGLEMTLTGTAAGTALDAGAAVSPGPDWRNRPARLSLSAENADGAALLAQLGVAVAGPQPAGSLDLSFAGVPSRGMAGKADLAALGLAAHFDGDLRLAGTLEPTGSLSVDAETLGPLSVAVARDLPAVAPLSLEAIVSPNETGIGFDALQGTAAGVTVAGNLAATAEGLSGALSLGTLDLGALGGLILGEDPTAGAETGQWSNAVFTDPLVGTVPVDLSLSATRASLGSLDLGEASFELAVSAGRLAVSQFAASLAGGELTGNVTLGREGARADLAGNLSLADADLSALVWQRDGAPVATGRLSMGGSFTASGYAPSGLVGGLNGEGTLKVEDGRIRALNPAPFDLVTGAVEGEAPSEDETRALFAAHLESGDLSFDSLEANLALSAGTLRLNDVAIDADGSLALASAAVDLGSWTLRSDWTLELRPPDADQIAVGLTFSGPIEAPQRQIDVSALSAWLNLRQLERQVQAVEEQNQELQAEANRYNPPLPSEGGAGEPAPATANEGAPQPEGDGAASTGEIAPPAEGQATETQIPSSGARQDVETPAPPADAGPDAGAGETDADLPASPPSEAQTQPSADAAGQPPVPVPPPPPRPPGADRAPQQTAPAPGPDERGALTPAAGSPRTALADTGRRPARRTPALIRRATGYGELAHRRNLIAPDQRRNLRS